MMMCKQRCISGYALNQKYILLMALKSWYDAGKKCTAMQGEYIEK